MGCASFIVKYIVFIFNIVCLIFGIALIAVGVAFQLNIGDYTSAFDDLDINFTLVTSLIITVGVVVFVISFFGCCGAIKENSCLLTTYAILLFVLFILQLALGVYAFLQFKDTDTDLKNKIHKTLVDKLHIYETDETAKEMIDAIQSELECCGVDGPGDWGLGGIFNLPSSCCKDKPAVCTIIGGPDLYTRGCFTPFYEFLQKTVDIAGIVIIVLAAIEVGAGIIALCLASSVRNN